MKRSIFFVTLLLLLTAGAASASLQVEILQASGNITDAAVKTNSVDTTGGTVKIGDQVVSNLEWWMVAQLNSTNMTTNIDNVVGVVVEYHIVGLTAATGLSGLLVNHSFNTSWVNNGYIANVNPTPSNTTSSILKGFFINDSKLEFDITSQFIQEHKTGTRNHTINVHAVGLTANGVANNIDVASADNPDVTLRPMIKIYYDTDKSQYPTIDDYNATNFYDNYFLGIIKTDNGTYGFQSNALPAGTIAYWIGEINNSARPTGSSFDEFSNTTGTGALTITNYTDQRVYGTATSTIVNGLNVVNKSWYVNSASVALNVTFGTLGLPFYFGRSNVTNASIEDNNGVVSNLTGIEDIGFSINGTLHTSDGINRNITGGFYDNEFTHSSEFVGGTQCKEFWAPFNTPETYGFLLYVDSKCNAPNDFSNGMIFIKATGTKYYFSKVAGLMTTYNDTATASVSRIPVNLTLYANDTTNGTLVLNATGYARGFNRHVFANVSGEYINSAGVITTLTQGDMLLEYDFSIVPYVRNLTNSRLFHEQYTTNLELNITAPPIDTTKNITIELNGTKSPLNVTYQASSGTIRINLTGNSSAGQSMNLTFVNNTYTISSDNTYSISNGTYTETSLASGNTVIFSKVAVGSDYSITQAPASGVTIPCLGWCYLTMNYSSKNLSEIDALLSNDTIQGRYNATSQKYEDHWTGYKFNENANVTQKQGYYAYFNRSTSIIINISVAPTISLKQGWNLVGNYNASAKNISVLKSSIGTNASIIKYYNRTLGTWYFSNTTIVPAGEAFFTYITSDTNWSG